ncbi:prolyl-tRNA synthetase associated domain-containing protein [Patescibacteria group bacterium]|nr:prolyl-tRNA synthetase associated domain-containing protein [Patescibacteria group bacterium]
MNIYETLKNLNIDYEKYEHKAVINVMEADEVYDNLGFNFQRCKNLFLRNVKGKKHFLFVTDAHKEMSLQELGDFLEEKLSFASPDRLKKYLDSERGRVSLLNLINDKDTQVILILDKSIVEAEKVGFHPDSNEVTLVLNKEGIQKFIESMGNEVIIYE